MQYIDIFDKIAPMLFLYTLHIIFENNVWPYLTYCPFKPFSDRAYSQAGYQSAPKNLIFFPSQFHSKKGAN